MKDFEAFKASRLARDPSTRGYTKYQWEKAYGAYQRARGGSAEAPGEGLRPAAGLEALLHTVRSQTAYAQTRALIEFLFWAVVVLVVLFSLLKAGIAIAADQGGLVLLPAALFEGVLGIAFAFLLRLLAEVVVDIPDIALFRLTDHPSANGGEQSAPERHPES